MQKSQVLIALALLFATGGCELIGFEPYDYDKNKRAKVKLPDIGCDVDVDFDQLLLKRKIPLPPLR